jgi:predicted peroxiredoxin
VATYRRAESGRSPGVAEGSLLIVVTTGTEEDGGRRAALAVGVGLAALAGGSQVFLFLSLASAPLGTPDGAAGIHPRGFSEPLETYIQHYLELGGKLEVCSSCYEEYCRSRPKDERGQPRLRAGTRIAGLSVVAERAGHMQTLTF